jgi:hypothetical protein
MKKTTAKTTAKSLQLACDKAYDKLQDAIESGADLAITDPLELVYQAAVDALENFGKPAAIVQPVENTAQIDVFAAEEQALSVQSALLSQIDVDNTEDGAQPAPALPTDMAGMSSLVAQLMAQIDSNKKPAATSGSAKSAKQFIRDLLAVDGAALTVDELCEATGKTAVNIRTALSDLRSTKYAGTAGVFLTKSSREGNITRYSKA